MANIGAYSRHRMLAEINSPLYSATKGGATFFLTPDEQRAAILANLNTLDAAPVTITPTTGATTVLGSRRRDGGSYFQTLTCTAFAVGTSADNASLGIGASLVSFPTGTQIVGAKIAGTFSGALDTLTNAITVGLGTTVASGAVAVLSGTPTFENCMKGQLSAAFADVGSTSAVTVNMSGLGGATLVTTTPGLAVFLNVAGAWSDIAAGTAITFTGTVELEYRV